MKTFRIWPAVIVAGISSAQAQVRSITLHPPARDYGYLVGDKFAAEAIIVASPDTTLDRTSLPTPGPVATAIDIASVTTEESDVDGAKRIDVRVTYQSFVAPDEVSNASVPGYEIDFVHQGVHQNAAVPGFDFSASTFRHDLTPVLDARVMRPDPPMFRVDDTSAKREILTGGVVAAGALALLASLRVRSVWLGGGRRPFAVAYRCVLRAPQTVEGPREALLALHRAFDAAGGRRILGEDVAEFVLYRPRFLALRADIDRFFALSQKAFFEPAGDAPALPELARLSRALARAERG